MSKRARIRMKGAPSLLRSEWPVVVVWATAVLWFVFGEAWAADLVRPWAALGGLAWICTAILFSAFAVVRHADVLAARYGEPSGTLILTIAVISL